MELGFETNFLWGENMRDYVVCNNCDETLLVAIGEEKCPECQFEGSMRWADDNRQEVEDDFQL